MKAKKGLQTFFSLTLALSMTVGMGNLTAFAEDAPDEGLTFAHKPVTCTVCNGEGECETCGGVGTVDCTGQMNETTNEATCTEDGEIRHSCETCGASYTTRVPAKGHKHAAEDEGVVVNEPGCEQYGTKRYTCTECDKPYDEQFGEPKEHDWGEWEIKADPTCGENGTQKRSCSQCTEVQSEIIPATGEHKYGSDGICLKCGANETPAAEMTEQDLRTAINAAAADGTVSLTGNVKLGNALNITKNLTLDLGGYTLSAAENYAGGLIKVKNADVTIKNGKLTGATGNAVYAEGGNLTMADCTVTGITGGAVKAMNVGDVTINNCNFSRNVNNSAGGALYVSAAKSLTVTGGSFVDNLALEGSAIYCGNLDGTTKVSFNNVQFEGNGVEGDRLGGAGALYLLYGIDATIQNCKFVGNGSTKNGGAILVDGSAGTGVSVSVEGCTFDGNKTNTCGGAIYGDSAKSLTVTNCTFTGNTAMTQGGAIYNLGVKKMAVTGGAFSVNTAMTEGGAIYAYNTAELTVTGGTFNGNQSNTWGGAIYNVNSATTVGAGAVVTNNIATYGGGGIANYSGDLTVADGAAVYGNNANYYGHDIYSGGTSKLTLTSAKDMNGKREGNAINGWYVDEQDNRWSMDNCTAYTPAENDSTVLALVAAYDVIENSNDSSTPGGNTSRPRPTITPTETPTETPSTEPSETPEEIELPEEETPLAELPEEELPELELPDEEIPLAELPEEEIEVPDEEVPLSGEPMLPQTGMNWLPAILLAVGGVSASATGLFLSRKKEEEEI